MLQGTDTCQTLLTSCAADKDYPAEAPPPLRFIRSCSSSLAATTLHKLEAAFHAPVLEVLPSNSPTLLLAFFFLCAEGAQSGGDALCLRCTDRRFISSPPSFCLMATSSKKACFLRPAAGAGTALDFLKRKRAHDSMHASWTWCVQ